MGRLGRRRVNDNIPDHITTVGARWFSLNWQLSGITRSTGADPWPIKPISTNQNSIKKKIMPSNQNRIGSQKRCKHPTPVWNFLGWHENELESGFDWVWLGSTGFDWVSTGFYWVWSAPNWFSASLGSIFLVFLRLNWNLPRYVWFSSGVIVLYRVLLGFTGFYRVWSATHWFLANYRGISLVFIGFDGEMWWIIGLYRVLWRGTGFYWVLLGFTGSYWVLLGLIGYLSV